MRRVITSRYGGQCLSSVVYIAGELNPRMPPLVGQIPTERTLLCRHSLQCTIAYARHVYRSTYGRRPVEILLVEDNPGDVRLFQEGLKEVVTSRRLHVIMDGDDAVDFIQNKGRHAEAPSPDLVLLDLNLPKKGGHEVLAEIKRNPRTKSTPVIVLTSSNAHDDVQRAYDLNANCYIQKPADLDGVLAMLRAFEAFWFRWAVLPSPRGRAGLGAG